MDDLPPPLGSMALRSVLMFAFQFPPFAQSTGRLRTLSFVRHLPELGWIPIVISARATAYPEVDACSEREIPEGTTVIRAWGFDIARAVSIRGIYPRIIATPDRWNSWVLGAYLAGRDAVRQAAPSVLWATFPTPSAMLACLTLHRRTRIPFIADFRDPMVYEHWPVNRWDRWVYRWLERNVAASASAVVVTTPSACELYRQRYSEVPASRFRVIENGIDDDDVAITWELPKPDVAPADRITLVHSGGMEAPDRDPTCFFRALRLLSDRSQLPRTQKLRVVLRASGNEKQYSELAQSIGVGDLVEVLPRISRIDAMKELTSASALLLFQGSVCNRQIPAKAYEYLASGKPIIGLMDPGGDTHALVHGKWGVPYCGDMADAEAIAKALSRFFSDFARDAAYVPPSSLRSRHSRRTQALELGRLLDEIDSGRQGGREITASGSAASAPVAAASRFE